MQCMVHTTYTHKVSCHREPKLDAKTDKNMLHICETIKMTFAGENERIFYLNEGV